MIKLFNKFLKCLFFGVLVTGYAFADDTAENDQWRFELKPLYVWLVSLDGSTSIPPSDGGSGANNTFDDSELSGAFSFHFEAGKGDWTLFTDYLYAEFTSDNIDVSPFPVSATNKLSVNIAELGATYRLLKHPRYLLELLGGVRYLYIDNKFDFNSDLFMPISAHANVWDGFGGLRFTGHILDSLSATVRADAGGGTSDLVWNVMATLDWRYRDWGSIYAGYRVLDYNFSEQDLAVNLQGKGPLFGFAFFW